MLYVPCCWFHTAVPVATKVQGLVGYYLVSFPIKSGRAVPFSRRRSAFSTVRLKEFLNFRRNDSGVNASWSMVKSGKWRMALNVAFALMLLKIIPIHGCSWLSWRQSKVSANIKSPVISNVVKLSQVLISTSWPLWAKSRSREMNRSNLK